MQIPPEFQFIASILSILGFTLATWALFDLGRSFGIVSGTRKKVTEGLYSIMRHPMYLGYVIAEFGFVLLNVSNIKVFIISVLLYALRAKTETKHLADNT